MLQGMACPTACPDSRLVRRLVQFAVINYFAVDRMELGPSCYEQQSAKPYAAKSAKQPRYDNSLSQSYFKPAVDWCPAYWTLFNFVLA